MAKKTRLIDFLKITKYDGKYFGRLTNFFQLYIKKDDKIMRIPEESKKKYFEGIYIKMCIKENKSNKENEDEKNRNRNEDKRNNMEIEEMLNEGQNNNIDVPDPNFSSQTNNNNIFQDYYWRWRDPYQTNRFC